MMHCYRFSSVACFFGHLQHPNIIQVKIPISSTIYKSPISQKYQSRCITLLSNFFTTNKPTLPITPIHPNHLNIKQQRPIHPRILQHEIQSPHATKRRGLWSHQLVFLILRGIGQWSVGENDLSNAPRFHVAEGAFEAGDEFFGSEDGAKVFEVFVECSALWSSLGLKRPPKITNSIPTPIKHHPITIPKISTTILTLTEFDILVRPTLGRCREVIVRLYKFGRVPLVLGIGRMGRDGGEEDEGGDGGGDGRTT
mmetsp:Transcript_26927/g.44178  ORF Transcript_26927/g.44178 Transcript_26927/m.44178 type:complete len:254 (-) Transcript_26927:179-940(-)